MSWMTILTVKYLLWFDSQFLNYMMCRSVKWAGCSFILIVALNKLVQEVKNSTWYIDILLHWIADISVNRKPLIFLAWVVVMVTRSKQIASSLCRDIIIQSLSDKEREAWFATKKFVRKNFIYYTQLPTSSFPASSQRI